MTWLITPQQRIDPDAAVYLSRVEAADGQALEAGVRTAVDNFVLGCKADGIWNAIKASCILSGARTLSGALVPLVGTEPSRFGTEGGWNYNRKTGLQGNGTNNYLNSNRNNNVDPQDSKHISAYLTEKGNDGTVFVSAGWSSQPGETALGWASSIYATINKSGWSPATSIGYASFVSGLFGASRSASSSFIVRGNKLNQTLSFVSQAPFNGNLNLYRSSDGIFYSNSRIAFYSIGESLNLALLDAHVTTLVNAISAAIP